LIPPEVFDTLVEPWMWRGQTIPAKTSRKVEALRPRPVIERAGPRTATPPPAPVAARARPRPSSLADRRTAIGLVAASMTGLIVVATLIGATSLFQPKFTGGVAGIQASGGDEPTLPPVAIATASPSPSEPSPSTSPGSIDPAQLASLQHGAWNTIRRLRLYAIAVNVPGAQRLLGDSAPGLRGSGLARADFPVVKPADIAITMDGTGWQATAGSDTLTSSNGTTWSFDYGNRPLARYLSTATRHMYFLGPSGSQHTVNVTVSSITISRSSILAAFKWSYGSDTRYGNDGPYFSGDRLVVSGLTLGGRTIPIADGVAADLGASALSAVLRIPGESLVPGAVLVGVAVIDPGRGQVDASFEIGG
jgi:hypothetical protein